MGHPQGEHRLAELVVEPVGRQAERPGIDRHQAAAERLHRRGIVERHLAEAGQVRGPAVDAAEALARQHVRVVRRQVALEEDRLVGVGRLDALHRVHPRGVAAEGQVALVVGVEGQRQLGLQRLGMEARGGVEGRLHQCLRHPGVADEVEAHLGEGAAQLGAEVVQRAGRAAQQRGEVEDGDLVGHGRVP